MKEFMTGILQESLTLDTFFLKETSIYHPRWTRGHYPHEECVRSWLLDGVRSPPHLLFEAPGVTNLTAIHTRDR